MYYLLPLFWSVKFFNDVLEMLQQPSWKLSLKREGKFEWIYFNGVTKNYWILNNLFRI